ncbi:MAG TPA: hypothetical protein VHF89_16615 [Solirubrobacteraceae bacterium]|nr:hypothetical protein [Solirubrobacteraceae bacterium]
MSRLAWRARAAVLVPLAAVGVHQVVYRLAGVRPADHAHAYLAWLTPALVALLFVAAAELGIRVLRAHRRPVAPPPRGRVLWPVLAALLAAVFVAQEVAEALLATGHAHEHALRELLVAHGLWYAGPVAAVFGGAVALLLRGAAAVERRRLAIVPARPQAPAVDLPLPPAPVRARRAPRDLLGPHLAGRAPPVVVA